MCKKKLGPGGYTGGFKNVSSYLTAAQRTSVASGKSRMWVVDEASMMGAGQGAKLLKMADRQDARVVLVGDRQQFPSIEAGKPFAILQDHGAMEVATMKNIIRQEDPELRAAVGEDHQRDGQADDPGMVWAREVSE